MDERVFKGRQARLKDVMKVVKKEHGGGLLTSGEAIPEVNRIPTGIFPIDEDLQGGIPQGRVTVLRGKRSSGKSTTALRIIAEAQGMCPLCWKHRDDCKCKDCPPTSGLFIDQEGTMTTSWAEAWGVDISQVLWSRPEHGEQMVEIVRKVIQEKIADIIVLDSVAQVQSWSEADSTAMDQNVASLARLMTRFIRTITLESNKTQRECGWRPTIILVNQIRDNISGYGGPICPGGHAIGFAASLELDLGVRNKPKGGIGHYKYRVEKSKVSMPNLNREYKVSLSSESGRPFGTVFDELEIFKAGDGHEIVRGKGYTCYGREFRLKEDVLGWIASDHEGRAELVRDIFVRRGFRSV